VARDPAARAEAITIGVANAAPLRAGPRQLANLLTCVGALGGGERPASLFPPLDPARPRAGLEGETRLNYLRSAGDRNERAAAVGIEEEDTFRVRRQGDNLASHHRLMTHGDCD
jgi:hypothetical protein